MTEQTGGPERAAGFSFTLPAASGEASGGQAASDRPRVLVVDQDAGTRMNMQNILAQAGFSPVASGNLHEAERLAESEQPHLVLTAQALP